MPKKNVKKRNWAFVLYPESAPSDWRDQLKQSGLMGAISPIHDHDLDPTGSPKKEHYHIIIIYDGPTTFNNVRSLTERLNQPIPQPLEQVRGYYRYLTHMDNPDKYQYDENDIETFNGFDISDFVELTKSEVNKIKYELLTIARERHISEYSLLVNYVMDNMNMDYFGVVSSNTMFFNAYLKSVRFNEMFPSFEIDENGNYVIDAHNNKKKN